MAITVIVTAAMIMFVLSIVNAMAQSYHRRMCKKRQEAASKNATSRAAKGADKKND